MDDVFEPILEVTEYSNGPRNGIALLHGKPHVFNLRFRGKPEPRGDFESMDLFDLVPVGAAINAHSVLAYAQFRVASQQPVQLPGEPRPLEVCWHVLVQVSA